MSRLLGCVLGCLFGCLLVGFASPVSAEDAHPPAAAGHGDVPKVPMDWNQDLALWSLVTFVAFCFVLNKMAWGPLKQGLDQREAGIRKEIADAEAAHAKAAALL
ncbi:MAG: ATP synthase F0 subunit B, partial [Planctomycetaceae bacterium]|nr:ATP synthase F0 subunit B [Planctomycetaceae bacterium]